MSQEREPIKIVTLDDVQISYFDEDPDGDQDRAGDGYYFQTPGSDSWSGAWQSEDECLEMAEGDLEDYEKSAYAQELKQDGFNGVSGMVWQSSSGAFDVWGRIDADMIHLLGIGSDRVEVAVLDGASVERMEIPRHEMNGRFTPGLMVVGKSDDMFDCLVIPPGSGELIFSLPINDEEGEFGHKHHTVRQAAEIIAARIEAELGTDALPTP